MSNKERQQGNAEYPVVVRSNDDGSTVTTTQFTFTLTLAGI
jgi:hypothetical protein